jgi:hypothetical protein
LRDPLKVPQRSCLSSGISVRNRRYLLRFLEQGNFHEWPRGVLFRIFE